MLGIKFMGEVPFHQVLLHGLLRDKNGEKMSKTKGNGIDPLEMIEVYGADALRCTLAAGTVLGRDMVLQESTIEGYRNFINKIWNATRFALGHREKIGDPRPIEEVSPGRFDQWILGRLHQVAREADQFLEQRRFNEATKALYHFVWHELCDWYVEISKPMLMGDLGGEAQQASLATLNRVLADSLKLLHPLMPFVTEELWQVLPTTEGYIIVQPYPIDQPASGNGAGNEDSLPQTAQFIETVQLIRTVRGENNVPARKKVDVVVVTDSKALRQVLEEEDLIFRTLAEIGELEIRDSFDEREGYAHGVGSGFEVFLSLVGVIDVDAERTRIGKELEKTREKIEKLTSKLDNPNFTGKAPAQVVEKNRQELSDLQTQLSRLNESLQQLPGA